MKSNGGKPSFLQRLFFNLMFANIYPPSALQLSEISICDILLYTQPHQRGFGFSRRIIWP
jgi:hypothetical protein